MKQFTGKTVEDAVKEALSELGIEEENLVYTVSEEKKGLFSKKATIDVYTEEDAAEYGASYLQGALKAMGVEVTYTYSIDGDVIKLTIDSERNPILIGKNGRTLQALNELVKLAISTKFRHRFRILLDVGDYKEEKYERVIRIAKRAAKDVIRNRQSATLEPMSSDERRMVHNALSDWDHIKTESSGVGRDRAITIKYVD